MRVTLHKIGSTEELDVTRNILVEQNLVLTEWATDNVFERVHGDVTLRLSDMAGAIRSLLTSLRREDRCELFIYNDSNQVAWRGEVQIDSTEVDVVNESVELTAFSKTKIFWEKASQIAPIVDDFAFWQALEDIPGYYSLSRLFLLLNERHNFWLNGTLFRVFNPGPYVTRKVRGVSSQPRPIGNEGRLYDLAEDFSLADLLEAFKRYYMCEFYIDHADGTLYMKRYLQGLSSEVVDIDGTILSSAGSLNVTLHHGKSYAAVYTPAWEFATEPQILRQTVVQGTNGLGNGSYQWLLVASRVEGGLPVVEVLSHPTDVRQVILPSGYAMQFELLMEYQSAIFNRRQLWRYSYSTGRSTLIAQFGNSGDILVYDVGQSLGIEVLGYPRILPYIGAWHVYHEDTGQWEIIYDINAPWISRPPEGEVLTIAPQLRWKDGGVDEYYYAWSFFGKERAAYFLRDDWITLLKTTRKAQVKTTMQYIPLYTKVRSSHLPPDLTPQDEYVIVKREDDIIDKVTTLEMVSL